MEKPRAIVTVGISESRGFGPYLDRFRATMRRWGCTDGWQIFDKEWPVGSPPHQECHYAFKVHAVYQALAAGFTSVLWFDCSAYAIRPIEPLWQRLERDGHVLIEDANALGKWSSDNSLAHFSVSRDEAMKMPLFCGTCWGLDLTVERSRIFLERLRALAVPEHFNGTHVSRLLGGRPQTHPRPGTEGAQVSNDERVWGHRSDEVYAALLARELGMNSHAGVEFVGGMTVTEQACVRSGYDL